MAIPSWAVEAVRRGVGGVMDKVPADTMDQIKKRANDLLAEIPQTAARGVDSVMRGARAGRDSLQRWTRRHVALVTPVVNASGCLGHRSVSGVPLSSEAIEIAAETFQAGALDNATAHERLDRRLARCVDSADLGILIASTVDGACLAVANANRDCPLYFHRSQSQRLPSGAPIPDAFGAATGSGENRVREVGSVAGIDPGDVRGISNRAVLVAVDNGGDGAVWFRSLLDASSTAGEMTRVLYFPVATWNATAAATVTPAVPSVLASLGRDADIIVTPGDGIIGGPRCGLIIGQKKRLEAIARCPVWPALVADPATQAAMVLTLETLGSSHAEDVPVHAMLCTNDENLRSRAERLATRIAAEPSVRSCQITANAATLCSTGPWSLPSRQLNLAHRDWSANEWAAKLISEVPAVVVGVHEDRIVVDLRWIQPSDDAALVATLVGHEPAVETPTG